MSRYLLIICFIYVAECNIYEANTTDLNSCKVHYSRSGSVYKDFYTISESSYSNDSLLLDFHFAVMAPSDAHILLAPSLDVDLNDPAYEIVIGAGGNTFCDIRRKQKSDVKASVRVKGLLSALDPNFFWIHITKDGVVEVGKDGEELPFISWIDPDPLPLKVISFSTWSGIEAKWYFDCERRNETEKIEKPLTTYEKLRRDLLYHYDPYARPENDASQKTTVLMSMRINHINFDVYKSTIELFGVVQLGWIDQKLKWNSDDYDDLKILHIARREIWQPELALFNGIGDGRDILKDSLMVVHQDGVVDWNPNIHLKAWCAVEDLGKWPRDRHRCRLLLGFFKYSENIELEFGKESSSLEYHDSSQWSVLEANVYSGIKLDNVTESMIQISLDLERSSNFYSIIFFTPFLLVSISLLLTFWMDPLGKMKISMHSFQLILTTIMLLALGIFAPNHSETVPYLVSLYSFSLVAVLIAIILAIVVINFSRNKQQQPVPHLLCSVLTSRILRYALCLPKVEMSDEYGKLTETSHRKSQERVQDVWMLLGVVIDRITFVVYLVLSIFAIYAFH